MGKEVVRWVLWRRWGQRKWVAKRLGTEKGILRYKLQDWHHLGELWTLTPDQDNKPNLASDHLTQTHPAPAALGARPAVCPPAHHGSAKPMFSSTHSCPSLPDWWHWPNWKVLLKNHHWLQQNSLKPADSNKMFLQRRVGFFPWKKCVNTYVSFPKTGVCPCCPQDM